MENLEQKENKESSILTPELRADIRLAFMNVLRNLISRDEKWAKGFGVVALLKDMEENNAPIRFFSSDRVFSDSFDAILANRGLADTLEYNQLFDEAEKAQREYYEAHKEEIEDESRRNREWVRQWQERQNRPITKIKKIFGIKEKSETWNPDWKPEDTKK